MDQNKKLANGTSFVMKHLHRMKFPRKQEHLPRKVQDHTMYRVSCEGVPFYCLPCFNFKHNYEHESLEFRN